MGHSSLYFRGPRRFRTWPEERRRSQLRGTLAHRNLVRWSASLTVTISDDVKRILKEPSKAMMRTMVINRSQTRNVVDRVEIFSEISIWHSRWGALLYSNPEIFYAGGVVNIFFSRKDFSARGAVNYGRL